MGRSIFSSRIGYNYPVAPDTYKMGICCKGVGRQSEPGQFVMIKTHELFDPLLCRPFAIHRPYLSQSTEEGIELLYRVVGKGTKYLSQLSKGEQVNGFGPLGRGFRVNSKKRSILVAGGIGVASLVGLAERLSESTRDGTDIILVGAKSQKDLLCIDVIRSFGWAPKISTEDGSSGHRGLVSDLLIQELNGQPQGDTIIYACGPIGMLKAIGQMATDSGISCQVSLEAQMACGTGACLGCVIRGKGDLLKPRSQGRPQRLYLRTCTEGPVFDASEIAWELV